jgi:putative transposase
MRNVSGRLRHIIQPASMLLKLIVDAVCYLGLCLRPNPKLAAEVLFLRKQLALYEERQVKPRRATDATRIVMVWLSHFFNWRPALRIVNPETFTRWDRQGFRLFWRWKSKPGSPGPRLSVIMPKASWRVTSAWQSP